LFQTSGPHGLLTETWLLLRLHKMLTTAWKRH